MQVAFSLSFSFMWLTLNFVYMFHFVCYTLHDHALLFSFISLTLNIVYRFDFVCYTLQDHTLITILVHAHLLKKQVACVSDLKYMSIWSTSCRHETKDMTQPITWTAGGGKCWTRKRMCLIIFLEKDNKVPSSMRLTFELFQSIIGETETVSDWMIPIRITCTDLYHFELNQ